jgi:hypothetical protein
MKTRKAAITAVLMTIVGQAVAADPTTMKIIVPMSVSELSIKETTLCIDLNGSPEDISAGNVSCTLKVPSVLYMDERG